MPRHSSALPAGDRAGRRRRAWRARLDQLSALHRPAGGRYRAARQGRPGLHRHPRGAVADGGPAAAHPCDGVQQRPDRQRARRRHRSRPAGRAGQGTGCGLSCQCRGSGARRLGIETVLDERTGRCAPRRCPAFRARVVQQADDRKRGQAAREFAAGKGINWDAITAEQKVALLKAGAAETRQAKTETGSGLEQKSDFAVWREQAAAASYRHRSVLRPDAIAPHRLRNSGTRPPISRPCRLLKARA